jgi:hypothetical protein
MTPEMQVIGSAGVSGASAVTAFVVTWIPVVQFAAAIIAVIAGVFAIAVSIKKLRS